MLRDIKVWAVSEDAGALLMARVVDWDGNTLTQAGVTSITWKCFDRDDNDTMTDSGTLTKTEVIFDTPQLGNNWPYSDGYTFKWLLPKTALPNGGHRYKAEIIVTPTAGADYAFPLTWHLDADNLLTS